MRQIKEGMIACTCDEVINIIDVIDLFSQSTIKDIERIINKEITLYWIPLEIRLYINTIRTENELSDKEICLEPAPKPFIIRKKEKSECKGVEFLCFSWLKSHSSIEDLEELSPYTKFSKFFFLRDDIDKYVRKHKNVSSKFTSDKPIESSDLTACDSTERETNNSRAKDDKQNEEYTENGNNKQVVEDPRKTALQELLDLHRYDHDCDKLTAIKVGIQKLDGIGSKDIVGILDIKGKSSPAKKLGKYKKTLKEICIENDIDKIEWVAAKNIK